MKKIILSLLVAIAVAGTASAQRRSTVSGVVADAETRQNLIGVLVGFAPASDSTAMTPMVSGAGGAFSTGLMPGEYVMEASILGYEKLHRRVTVTDRRTDLGTILLRPGIEIDAIVKEAVALRTSLSGDTLIYNADSYKVASDATVSGLLEKMPGIKVEDGAVEAQGEAVRKVLIDGREFFGEDVAAAISALPAEAVKSVEVFDKLSDNAEFTGIDDGEGYKAINITTRENMRQGVMGQVSALYGVEPPSSDDGSWNHYGLASGNVSVFHGDAKITVGGTLNNLNERHFTSEDILGAGDNDGIAKVGRFQANYIDEWGKRNQWKVDASYTYGVTDADNHSIVAREYYDLENAVEIFDRETLDSRQRILNQNHAFNARIDFKPNQFHELRIRPYVRFQGRDDNKSGLGTYYPVDENDTEKNTVGTRENHETGWMAGANLNYRVRLGKPGRTLSIFMNGMYDPDDHTGYSFSQRMDGTTERKSEPSSNYEYDLMGGLTYTEPVGEGQLVNLDYMARYNYSDNDSKVYFADPLWDPAEDPAEEEYYSTPEAERSGVYNSGYLTQRVGPGYRMQKGETTLSVGAFYQYSTLESTRELPVAQEFGPHNFHNFTYSAMLNSQFGHNKNSVRVFLHSRTRNPGVVDMQDVVNTSDLQNISTGNPNLRPSYGHMLYTRMILPNTEKGRTLAFNFGASYTTDAIVRRTISNSPGFEIRDSEGTQLLNPQGQPMVLDAIGRYSESVNMDGQWSARFGVDYGFPLTFIKSNLNLDAGVELDQMPSQMGRWTQETGIVWRDNHARNMETEVGVTLGSNISEKIDFRVNYELEYNNVRNTASAESNSDYLRHRVRANFKFVLPLDFTISGNMSFYNYQVLKGRDFNQQYFIANAGIGKKIFRSRQGEVSIFVNDIFNQNVGFRRRAYPEYIQNETFSAVGRYFGVKLTWNIRRFGKNGSQNASMYNIDDHQEHNHGGGGRGGFGGGGGHRH
ncbi:MAG: outer membrane beta-barrel protein [Alistipes sp.]|jgi:hypothetical protein|nr:outer membrane beta-barrel protein [Alistipes sp.]